MGTDYTTVTKGITLMMVIIHYTTTHMGLNFFTPLWGGVAILLMASGYDLMESFKKKGLKDF